MRERVIAKDAMGSVVQSSSTDPDEIRKLLFSMRQVSSATFLGEMKTAIGEFLTSRGWPDPGVAVFHKGGFWCLPLEGEEAIGRSVSPGWAYTKNHAEPLSPDYEVAGIYFRAIDLEHTLAAGDLERTFHLSYALGCEVMKSRMRAAFLKPVTARRKQTAALKEQRFARDRQNANRAEERNARAAIANRLADEIRHRRGPMSKANLARLIVQAWPRDSASPSERTIRGMI